MAHYPEELEGLRFTGAQKEDMISRLTAEKAPRVRRRPRLSYRAAVALAAAVSLLIGAAGAVSLTGLSPEFRSLFGIADEQQEEDLGALAVEQTFLDKNGSGASVTVKDVVADQERLYVLMDFTAPKGTVLPVPEETETGSGYWLWSDLDTSSSSRYIPSFYADKDCTREVVPDNGYGSSAPKYLMDDDPTDNVIPLLFTLTTDRGFPADARYFHLAELTTLCTHRNGEVIPLLDGMDIELTVPMRGTTQIYSFDGRSPVKLGGTTMAVVENLSISSISLTMDLIIPDGDAYDAALAAQNGWPLYVLLRDGTRVSARFENRVSTRDWFSTEPGEITPEGGQFFRADHVSFLLERPIDVAEIDDIVFVGDNDRINEVGRIVYFGFTPGDFYNETYWDDVNKIREKTADKTAEAPQATSAAGK